MAPENWTTGIVNDKPENDPETCPRKTDAKFTPEFKAKVALEALKGIEPVHAIAAR